MDMSELDDLFGSLDPDEIPELCSFDFPSPVTSEEASSSYDSEDSERCQSKQEVCRSGKKKTKMLVPSISTLSETPTSATFGCSQTRQPSNESSGLLKGMSPPQKNLMLPFLFNLSMVQGNTRPNAASTAMFSAYLPAMPPASAVNSKPQSGEVDNESATLKRKAQLDHREVRRMKNREAADRSRSKRQTLLKVAICTALILWACPT
jgi:hypothetical protein